MVYKLERAMWKMLFSPLLVLGTVGASAHEGHHGMEPQSMHPAAPGARAPRPQLGSGVAFAPDGRLWLVGVNPQGALFVQSAPANDLKQWDAPRVLDIQGDTLSADGENRPKLAFGPKGWVVISYTQPLPQPEAGQVRMLHSTDGGQTFSAPVTAHTDRQLLTHRFEAMAFDAQGALHTVWLDGRDQAAAPKVGAKSSYRGFAVYRNVSLDGGATFGPDLRVADHSCECCRLAVAVGTDGRVRALWRHVFEPNVRDHAIAVLDAKPGSAPPTIVRATLDDWRIDACPHNGPALAAAADGGFHAVWFGMRQQGGTSVAAVRYGRLNADGSPVLSSVRALPDARAEHADVQAAGDRVAVVWRSSDGARTTLKAWLSTDGGRSFVQQELGEVTGPNDFPRLVQQGGRMVAVWRTPTENHIYELAF